MAGGILWQLAGGGFDPGGSFEAGANDAAKRQTLLQQLNSVYGTPIYGTKADGSTAVGTFDKRGQFHEVATPGFQPTPGIKTIDTGTGTVVLNSRSGAQVGGGSAQPAAGQPQQSGAPALPGQPAQQIPGYYPKDVQGEAQQKKYGTETGDKQATFGKATGAMQTSMAGLDRLAKAASDMMNDPGLTHITGLYGMLPNIPGGTGANSQAQLANLKSQAGFTVLQAMRDMSKTGGALGQISNYEDQLLQNNLAGLDQSQDATHFKANLQKIVDYVSGAKERLQGAYNTDYGSIKPSATPNPAAINALKQNPALRGQFEAKYGPGSASQVLGQ